MTQDLELRVLTGLHHGARCLAQDGALIGSHADCDVVLCDDGIAEQAVRLRIGETAWHLLALDDPQDTAPALPFGAPFALGPIHVSVAPAADPWPDPDELSAMLRFAEESPNDADDSMPDAQAEGWDPANGAAPYESAFSASNQEDGPGGPGEGAQHLGRNHRRKGSGLRWAFGGLFVLLIFGGAASFSPAGVQSSPHVTSGPIADEETLSRARQLLRRLGFADRVRASLSSDQEILVTGWVRDAMDRDQLATALTEIWPLPMLQVGDQAQMAAHIAAQAADLDVRIVVDYPGPGVVAIRGIAESDAVRTEALARWHAATVDTSPQVTATLLLAGEVSDALNEAVTAAGLPRITANWKDKTLHVTTPHGLDVSQRERLGSVLDTLNATYMNALQVEEDEPPKPGSIPFRIHSVVGGEQPWVMLEDGTRIVVGGTHGAYRLTSIEDGRVVFDGPSKTVIAR